MNENGKKMAKKMAKNPLTRDRTRDLKITSSMRTRQLQSCALPAELSEDVIDSPASYNNKVKLNATAALSLASIFLFFKITPEICILTLDR